MKTLFDDRASWMTRAMLRAGPATGAGDEHADSRPSESGTTSRYRAVFISDLHLGTPGCQADGTAGVSQSQLQRLSLPGGRHRGRLAAASALVLAAGAQRCGAKAAAPCAQGLPRDLRAGQPRRVRARLRRSPVRRHRGRGGCRARDGRRAAAVGHPWRLFRRRHPVRQVAGLSGRQPVRVHAQAQPLPEPSARQVRLALLVVVGLPQAQGEEGGQLHRRLRDGGGARGASARPPGRGLRPYPPRRDARDRGHPVLQ